MCAARGYLTTMGPEGRVAELAGVLLDLRVADFSILAEDRQAAERFRTLGAEVFEGPVGALIDPPDP